MFVLLVTIGGISAIVLAYVSCQRCRAVRGQPSYNQSNLIKDTQEESQMAESYGKIRLPADISIDLIQTEDMGAPVTIVVSASSKVAVSSGVVTLKVPQIDGEPNDTTVLWSGNPFGLVDETAEYVVNALPVGTYRFIAVFEFTPDSENAERLALSKSLYLDVRPTTILFSNVSFNHIKRTELLTELEKRVLIDLRPELKTADERTVAGEIADLKARDPGIIARKIAELAAVDPNIARRILELHREKVDISVDPNEVESANKDLPDANSEPVRSSMPSAEGKPTVEEPVPVPEELRVPNDSNSTKEVELDAEGEPIRGNSPPSGGKPTVEEPVPVPDRTLDEEN
jgi:hypothetical protein